MYSKIIWVIVGSVLGLIVVVAGVWIWITQHDIPLVQPPPAAQTEGQKRDVAQVSPENQNSVKIFQVTDQGVVMIERSIRTEPLAVKAAEAVVNEFLKTLPPRSGEAPQLIGAYRDRNFTIYLDFSSALRAYAVGDAKKEHNLLRALVLTVVSNVNGVQDVRLLIEGKELSTLAGHVPLTGSLLPVTQNTERPPR